MLIKPNYKLILYFMILVVIPLPILGANILTTSLVTSTPFSIPLSNNTLITAFCDDTSNSIVFNVYYTNGTLITNTTTIDSTNGGCNYNPVSVSAINSTSFVIGWTDSGDSTGKIGIYNYDGSILVSPVTIPALGQSFAASVSVMDIDHISFTYMDNTPSAAMKLQIFNRNLTNITSEIVLDSTSNQLAATSSKAINSTAVIITWSDPSSTAIRWAIYNQLGVALTSVIAVSTNVGQVQYLQTSIFDNRTLVLGFFDASAGDSSFRIYDVNTTAKTAIIDVDTNSGASGAASAACSVSAINPTSFVYSYHSTVTNKTYFATYLSNGTLINYTEVDSGIVKFNSVASFDHRYNIGFCNRDAFIINYVHNTTLVNWDKYYYNGSIWDGNCQSTMPSDSCTYQGSGTWNIIISDNCTLDSQTINAPIYINGSNGILTINGTVNAKNISFVPSIFNGGYIIRILKGFSFNLIK